MTMLMAPAGDRGAEEAERHSGVIPPHNTPRRVAFRPWLWMWRLRTQTPAAVGQQRGGP